MGAPVVAGDDGAKVRREVLPADAQGGEYVLSLAGDDGSTDRRTVVVAAYEAPRLKKTLELLR